MRTLDKSAIISTCEKRGEHALHTPVINEMLKIMPHPIPKNAQILQELEKFAYAIFLDLNMGYYTIKLDSDAQKLCTIDTPFGKYQYLRLPMCVSCSPDLFQEKMSDLMQHLNFVRIYLDDL
jgi:hypothetical protein